MTTVDRLEELLDVKDAEIERLEEELRRYELQKEWRWTLHTILDADTHDLPLPRLEMRCFKDDDTSWYSQRWVYSLVYKNMVGEIVFVPLGESRGTGYPSTRVPDEKLIPARNGANMRHDAKVFNLPAYVIVEESTYKLDR